MARDEGLEEGIRKGEARVRVVRPPQLVDQQEGEPRAEPGQLGRTGGDHFVDLDRRRPLRLFIVEHDGEQTPRPPTRMPR